MRRVAFFIALILIFSSLVSCGGGNDASDDRLTVITTIFPQYDFVRAIVGDRAEVSMLLAPKAESHTYEPSMADIKKVSEAELFIYTGNGIDEWAENMAESLKESDVLTLASARFVTDTVEADYSDHDHSDHYHDHEEHSADEHIWTSPVNAKKMLYGILEAIVELDPDNADFYRENAEKYASELDSVDELFKEVVAEGKRSEIIVADRFPFAYLTSEYGLEYTAALSGCSVGQEPSASVIAEMISKVSVDGISYVFIIENSDGKTAKLVSEATGCGILTLHSCHNVTAEQLADGVTYVDLMRQNAENLRLALN